MDYDNYENNLKKRHKERLYIALVLIVAFGIFALIDYYFSLGLIEQL